MEQIIGFVRRLDPGLIPAAALSEGLASSGAQPGEAVDDLAEDLQAVVA